MRASSDLLTLGHYPHGRFYMFSFMLVGTGSARANVGELDDEPLTDYTIAGSPLLK